MLLKQAAKEKEAEISHRGRYVLRVDATEALHPYDTSVSVAPELTSLSMEDVVQIPVLEDTTATIGCKLAGPCATPMACLHTASCHSSSRLAVWGQAAKALCNCSGLTLLGSSLVALYLIRTLNPWSPCTCRAQLLIPTLSLAAQHVLCEVQPGCSACLVWSSAWHQAHAQRPCMLAPYAQGRG